MCACYMFIRESTVSSCTRGRISYDYINHAIDILSEMRLVKTCGYFPVVNNASPLCIGSS